MKKPVIVILASVALYSALLLVLFSTNGINSSDYIKYTKDSAIYKRYYYFTGYGQSVGKGEKPYWYNDLLRHLSNPGVAIVKALYRHSVDDQDVMYKNASKSIRTDFKEDFDWIEISSDTCSAPPDLKYFLQVYRKNKTKLYYLNHDLIIKEWGKDWSDI